MAKVKFTAHEIPHDRNEKINWLRAWEPLDPANFRIKSIDEFKQKVQGYVQRRIDEYNSSRGAVAHFRILEFNIETITSKGSTHPKIKFFAYLDPPVQEPKHHDEVKNQNQNLKKVIGGPNPPPDKLHDDSNEFHLIPPSPDQPGDSFFW